MRTSPAWRRKYEKEIVELYYSTLIEYGEKNGRLTKDSYPIERCWKDYAFFGMNREIFYLPLCMFAPEGFWMKEKCETVLAFIEDHNITAENVQPMFM